MILFQLKIYKFCCFRFNILVKEKKSGVRSPKSEDGRQKYSGAVISKSVACCEFRVVVNPNPNPQPITRIP